MLGAEIAESPGFGRQHPEILAPREVGAVGQHELHMVAQCGPRDRLQDLRERMGGRGHMQQAHDAEKAVFQVRRRHGARAADPHRAGAVEHQSHHRP